MGGFVKVMLLFPLLPLMHGAQVISNNSLKNITTTSSPSETEFRSAALQLSSETQMLSDNATLIIPANVPISSNVWGMMFVCFLGLFLFFIFFYCVTTKLVYVVRSNYDEI